VEVIDPPLLPVAVIEVVDSAALDKLELVQEADPTLLVLGELSFRASDGLMVAVEVDSVMMTPVANPPGTLLDERDKPAGVGV
jgi:hypothetical protein